MESDNKGEKYMKKKGFTLIELLAVIVILAIIAVITVPKIADMISSSRQGGAEDSFYGTLKAAELGYTKALQSNINLKGSTCTITDSKINCTNGVEINVSGKTPESGTLIIDSAGSTMAKSLTLNGYKCYGDLSTESPCVKSTEKVVSETLIDQVTTSGDGLYKDNYTDGRYVYKGINPNNYIKFNNELWRIISIESDGTIKIINNTGKIIAWDEKNNRNSKTSTYCTEASTNGCNAWSIISGNFVNNSKSGTVIKNASINDYLNVEYYKNISSKAKGYIMNHNFNVGFIKKFDNIQNIINDEKSTFWLGNVGLINMSDYVQATLDVCNTTNQNNWNYMYTNISCKNNNWLYKYTDLWTITPIKDSTSAVIDIYKNGSINVFSASYNTERKVYPVVYLYSNIQLEGTGTEIDPYIIK